jgi:hypothetical protein
MSSQTGLSVAAMVLSVMSVVVSGLLSARTVRLGHALDTERDVQRERDSALAAARRIYEPLAQAAAELQSRIYNMVSNDWVTLTKRYEQHGDYVLTSTAFLFAHYFGWIEARRQAVLTSSGAGGRDAVVSASINQVRGTLRESEHDEGFLFFNVEQRAIGELMFAWDPIPDSSERHPHVLGYAAFCALFRTDPEFRRWFRPVETGIEHIAESKNGRLTEIHGELIALIKVLDPERKYTTRYDLRPISPS